MAILDFSVSGLCRWQGFWDVSQACFGISISNFICMLMVVIGKSLLIFSEVTFKMAAWWPYWIFWFPDSNFSLALNINCKLKWHNTYIWVRSRNCGCLVTWLCYQLIAKPGNKTATVPWPDPYIGRSLLIFSDVTFKMAAWRPYWIFWFPD